jgi:hypothetical protein
MAVGEWDQRQLCPDGTCVGVIGPDGTCKVCGRAAPNWGDERNRGLIDPEDPDEANLATAPAEDEEGKDDDEDGDEDGDDDEYEDDDEEEEDGDGDGDGAEAPEPGVVVAPSGVWSARQLCPDGACIGVIGPDGRCKVCGRRASEIPAAAAPPPSEPASTPAVAATSEPASTPAVAATSEPAPASSGPEAGPAIDSRQDAAPSERGVDRPIEAAAAAPAAGDHEPCPTPGCSGQIGADGRCAVCGKGAS